VKTIQVLQVAIAFSCASLCFANPPKVNEAKAENAEAHATPLEKSEKKPHISTLERPGCELMPQKKASDLWEVAECYFKMGLSLKAGDVLKEIAKKDPRDLDAFFTASWMLWNESLSKQGDLEKHFQDQSLEMLNQAVDHNPTDWQVYVERGDHFYLRLNDVTKAYAEYIKAQSLYQGDFSRKILPAEVGRKASIEARIARTTEKLGRKGESVEASCRALYFDPDDKGSKDRIERLHGSCTRKKVADPRKEENKSENTTQNNPAPDKATSDPHH